MRRTLLLGVTGSFLLAYTATLPGQVNLSEAHRKAAQRSRRIIFQDDVGCSGMPFTKKNLSPEQVDSAVGYYMSRLDAEPNQIDSVWYEWGEGNIAQWRSKVLPTNREIFPEWWAAGLDPIQLLLEGVKKRGREVFFSYRVNGSDNGFGEFKPPMKIEHPEWMVPRFERKVDTWRISIWNDFWDFSFPEVRDYKVKILREVAEIYDFDGISIDYARVPLMFPEGTQWQRRDLLTDFMRQVRLALLEVGEKRGRPYLLATRVPENLLGCHFDGLDVEAWARENLIDIFVVGCRSSDADLFAFRHITKGTGIKLYPSFDDHHSSDGYIEPSVELWRGVCTNWWRQGADGIHTFNLVFPDPEAAEPFGYGDGFSSTPLDTGWKRQREIYRDIGSLETLQQKDKLFYVQRRGGGHGKTVVPDPENWHTPRHMYFNTNMFAPLPAPLDNAGKADTLLTLYAGDDVMSAGKKLKSLRLHLLLSDPEATDLADDERLQAVRVAPRRFLDHMPPAKGIEKSIEVRLNNLSLGEGRIEAGWIVFDVKPVQLALGENLVGIRVKSRPKDARQPLIVEKLELHMRYRKPMRRT